MAYYNEDQLKRYLEKAIKAESESRIEKLKKEIDYLYSTEMSKVNTDIELKKKLEMNKALRELQIEYQDKINQIGIGYDEQLIKERAVMISNVFEAVYKKLYDFRNTIDYKNNMIEKYEAALKYAEQTSVMIEIGKDDAVLNTYFKTMNQPYTTSSDIHFGGFKAMITDKNICIDETIDTKLEIQKKWFYEQAKLFIKH